MKTTSHLRSVNPARRAWASVAVTFAVLGAILLGGVCVRAGTTNYYWNNTSSDYYTNDANWVGGVAPMGGNNITPSGSTNYTVLVTNGGTILYGDGGGGSSSGYTWTNMLGELEVYSNSTVSMNSDSLTITNASGTALDLSGIGSLSGTFSMSGGTLTVARNNGNTDYQDGFIIGNSVSPGTGVFTLSSGMVTALCGFELGAGGIGTLNVSGGVFIGNGYFGIGRGSSTTTPFEGFATLNLSGGTVYVLRNSNTEGSTDGLELGQVATNTIVNISGGTIYAVRMGLGPNVNASVGSQTVNISGGSLYIGGQGVLSNNVTVTTADQNPEFVNISGGTFHTADMLIISTSANVGNTNTVLSDGTNWTWAVNPPVNLTNSSFLVNGASGPGFVTFAPEANRTITLDNQWSGVGGFVVNGPGTVISANNGLQNVQGGVTVSNGTLVVNGTIPNAGGLTVQGGTLALSPNTATTGIGSLTTSNVIINATMNYKLNTATTIGAGVNDLLVVSNLTLGASSVLNVIPLSQPALGSTYVVAQCSGTLTGNFGTVTDSVNDTFSVSTQNNEILLTVVNIGSGNFDWIAPSAADWSVANDWNLLSVPAYQTAYVVVTNSVPCDYSSSDTYTVGGLYVGTNSFGTVNMSGGTLNVTNTASQYVLTIGGGVVGASSLGGNVGGPGIGTLTMSGGTLNVARNNGGTFQQDGFVMGLDTGSSGTFNLSGGTANIWCGMEMGCEGASTLNVSGGALVDTGWFHVGEGINSGSAAGNGSATFNLSGGAVYILPNYNGPTYSGINGGFTCGYNVSNAVANISGGSIYCPEITMSCMGGIVTNTLNIVGGLIYVGSFGVNSNAVAGSNAVNQVNISGGTFHTADMLITSNGIPVPQYTGVIGSTNNILSDGTNWSWAATLPVNLTNSTFAVPNGLGGMATGPGVVTFAPEATRTITLANSWSGPGSMNFAGPGMVVTAGIITANSVTISGGTYLDESPHFNVPLVVISGGATFELPIAANLTSPLVVSNNSSPAVLIDTAGITFSTATANMTYTSGTPAWSITGTLTLASGATMSINNTGSPLGPGSYLIVSTNTASSKVAGTVPANFTLGGAGIAPGTSAFLSISNSELYLDVTPLPQPLFTSVGVNGTTLNLTATNFVSGGLVNSTCVLLESTNLLSGQWTPVLTNAFNGSGLLNLSTNVINPNVPAAFYMLEY